MAERVSERAPSSMPDEQREVTLGNPCHRFVSIHGQHTIQLSKQKHGFEYTSIMAQFR